MRRQYQTTKRCCHGTARQRCHGNLGFHFAVDVIHGTVTRHLAVYAFVQRAITIPTLIEK